MATVKLKKIRCEICNSDKYALYRKNSGLNFVRCNNCGLVYVNPQPTISYLKDFYNKGEYREERWDFVPDYIDVIEKGHRRTVQYIVKNVKNKKPIVLDIGAGLTLQYEFFERKGWKVLGTELSQTFVDYAKKKGWNVAYGDILKMKFKDKEFDAITLMAVLEHLTNPKAYLRECHRIMKDSGMIVIKIPNLNYTLMNSTKLPLSEQMHLFHFTPKTIKLLLDKCDFEVIKNEPVLECGSQNKFKHFVMLTWDKMSWIIYKTTGLHTNLQMNIYARKKKK